MQQVITGGLGVALTNNATSYIYPYGHVSPADATITNSSVLVPEAGVLSGLRIVIDGAAGAGKSYTFTMYVNGIASTLTCAISGASATSDQDVSHNVTVAAGDLIALECVPASTPTARAMRFAYEFTPTAATTAVLMGGASVTTPNASATRYNQLGGCETGWDATVTNRAPVWNIDATIKTLYVQLATAPGAGKSRAFAIMKNGSAEASSVITIAEAATTASVTGLAIDLAPGDNLALRSVPSGTPDATAVIYWGMSYSPDTDGQYCMTGIDQNAINTTNTFNSLTQYPIAWTATEADRSTKAGGATTSKKVIYKSLRVELSAAPGVGTSRTFALNVDTSSSALSVTIADANTTGVTAVDVEPTRDQLITLEHTATGAAAGAFVTAAVLMQTQSSGASPPGGGRPPRPPGGGPPGSPPGGSTFTGPVLKKLRFPEKVI